MRISKQAPYVAICFASAFLLFVIQPLIAKAITPQYGGSASVWNSAMMVSQILLLTGSIYAYHLLSSKNQHPKLQHVIITAVVILLSLILPFYVIENPLPAWTAGLVPELAVPAIMAMSMGPAMILLGSQSPVIQRSWAIASGDSNPYPLFISSNAGSLLGLIAYPFIFEPFLSLENQITVWKVGVIATIAASGALMVSSWKQSNLTLWQEEESNKADNKETRQISKKQQFSWLIRAMMAVIVMMSAGQAISSDIMSMPLVWIFPLAAFLVGYMTAFSEREETDFKRNLKLPQTGIVILGITASNTVIMAEPAAGILALISIGLVTHGLMRPAYQTRPPVGMIARFYLILSVGGAIGGIIASIIAPQIFNWRWELPIAVAISAFLMMPTPSARPDQKTKTIKTIASVIAVFGGIISIILQIAGLIEFSHLAGILLVTVAITILTTNNPVKYALWIVWMMISLGLAAQAVNSAKGMTRRSYYGIMEVEHKKIQGEKATLLIHGTTIHGNQIQERPNVPTAYYTDKSGVGDVMKWANIQNAPVKIGVAGLGTGSIACIAPRSSDITYYEIDEEIIKTATDDFTFIKSCAENTKIILGDARLMIKKSAKKYDIMIIDAFTSDAIPMHLVTSQALDIYTSKLNQNGWLIIHVSNRYLNVKLPISGWSKTRGYEAYYLRNKAKGKTYATDSEWIAVRPDGWKPSGESWKPDDRWIKSEGGTLWTDRKSSILQILEPF